MIRRQFLKALGMLAALPFVGLMSHGRATAKAEVFLGPKHSGRSHWYFLNEQGQHVRRITDAGNGFASEEEAWRWLHGLKPPQLRPGYIRVSQTCTVDLYKPFRAVREIVDVEVVESA